MNITREDTGNLTATLKVEVKQADYAEKVQKILKDYQRKANLPGFRPGHVPMGVVNKMYGTPVMLDEINKLIDEELEKYLEDNKIDILGRPLPDAGKMQEIDFKTQNDFDFWFEIGLAPEFQVELTPGIQIREYHVTVEEKNVKSYTEGLQRRHGEIVNPEQAAMEDFLTMYLQSLDADGNVDPDGLKVQKSIWLQESTVEPFKSKFTGAKAEDAFDLRADETGLDADALASALRLSSEEAAKLGPAFRIKIDKVTRLVPAALGEDFFRKVYPYEPIASEEEFYDKVRADLSHNYEHETEHKFMDDVTEKLIDMAGMSLPDEFLKKYLFETRKEGTTMEDIERDYPTYATGIKWQLIESKIMKDNHIVVMEEDVRQYVRDYFSKVVNEQEGEEGAEDRLKSVVDNFIEKNPEDVKKIYDRLYDEKLKQLLKSKLSIEQVAIPYDEFVKIHVH